MNNVSFRQLLLVIALFCLIKPGSAAQEQTTLTGEDLSGWRKPTGVWMTADSVSLEPTNAEKFMITPGKGVIVNGPGGRAKDFVTEKEFGDLQAHVEFAYLSTRTQACI